jgi:hypothetical protein
VEVHIEGNEHVEVTGMRASLRCRTCGHSWGVSLVGPDHDQLPEQALLCSRCEGKFTSRDGMRVYEHATYQQHEYHEGKIS